jgi:hypothetical protein
MKMSQQRRWILIMVALLSLAWVKQETIPATDTKAAASKTKEELSQNISLKDLLDQTKQVVVFQRKDKERKYIGNLAPNSSALQKLRTILSQSAMAKREEIRRLDYEIVLVGGRSYWLAKYNIEKGIVAVYAVQQNELKPAAAVKLTRPLQDILASAKRLSQPKEGLNLSAGNVPPAQLRLPPRLEQVVKQSTLILLGTPVAVLDDRYDSEAPERYKVYLIGVEQYLKNAVMFDLPIVALNHRTQPVDPHPQFGKQYLFFLKPPRSDVIVIGSSVRGGTRRVIKIYEPGEFSHYPPEALLENGRAIPVCESYAPNWVPWMKGSEQEVLDRIRAEIRRQ